MFDNYIIDSYQWLNAERAKQISTIIKKNGGSAKRVAQERGALNVCKIIARFDSHSWTAAIELKNKARKEVIESGLTDSLTF
jgi:hypothetical protein